MVLTKFDKTLESLQSHWYEVFDPSHAKLSANPGFIRDPIHGHIRIDPLDFIILDSPPLQRLRGLAQLSFVDRIYPGANHTRFEHSLGVATLANKVLRSLKDKQERSSNSMVKIKDQDLISARIAAYFHDVGHLPFSHVLEPLFENLLEEDYSKVGMKAGRNKPHELLGYLIIESDYVRELIRRINNLCNLTIDPDFVACLSVGSRDVNPEKSYLREIVHSEFDCDRMDYLLRDGYYCGVPHGAVDPERLAETFTLVKRESGVHLGVEESGLPSIEAMYASRSTMYITVYYHHTSRIIEGMTLRAVADLVKNRQAKLTEFMKYNDGSLIEKMKLTGTGLSREVIERLEFRRLLKRLFVRNLFEINSLKDMKPGTLLPQKVVLSIGPILHKVNEYFRDFDNIVEYERNCSEAVYAQRVQNEMFLIDCPRLFLPGEPDFEEYFAVRLRNKTVKNILELSPVVRAIAQERTAYVTSIMFAGLEPEKYGRKAQRYAEESFKSMFGLDLRGINS